MPDYKIDEAKLEAIDNLPTLPTVASQLLELLNTMDVSMQAISNLMTHDPSITAQVLRIANSAIYGLRVKVDTVPRALVVLGVKEIRNIILSLSLFKAFPNAAGERFSRKAFWSHSGVTGFLCATLAQRFNIETHGEEFTAGLVHDIGKIVIDQFFHEGHGTVALQMAETGKPSWEAEEDVLGMSHAEIGDFLGARWRIPPNIRETIRYHHTPWKATEAPELTALVHLADMFAVKQGYAQKYNHWTPDIYASPAWKILGISPGDYDREELERLIDEQQELAAEFLSLTL